MNNRTKKLFALGMIISLSLGQAHVISAEPTTQNKWVVPNEVDVDNKIWKAIDEFFNLREGATRKIATTIAGAGLSTVSGMHLYAISLDGAKRADFFEKWLRFSHDAAVARSLKYDNGTLIPAKIAGSFLMALGVYAMYKTWKPAPKPSTENKK